LASPKLPRFRTREAKCGGWIKKPGSIDEESRMFITFLFFGLNALAAGCNQSGVCVGDASYAFYRGAVHAGNVKGVRDESILFLTKGEAKASSIDPKNVATVKPGACLATDDACVGYKSTRKQENGGTVSGKIVGIYTTGYVVVNESGTLTSLAPGSFDTLVSAMAVPENPAPPPVAVDPDAGKSLDELAAEAKKGQPLKLQDLLKFWIAGDAHPGGPNPFTACLDRDQENHPAKHTNDWFLTSDCAPDTLYSWGPMKKIRDLESSIGAGAWKKRPFFNDALFLAESPASSFGYGSGDDAGGYAIRAKIRHGVRFKFLREAPTCATYEEAEASNTVYIHIFTNDHGDGKQSSGQDFVLCSSGPLESWSYGTKQFYDELVNDVVRIRDPSRKNDHISYMTRPDAHGKFQPAIFELGSDGHPFSTGQLINTLKLQLTLSSESGGKVYYNPKLRDSPGASEAAFKTRLPSWFNTSR
jgi:hypothetical protein